MYPHADSGDEQPAPKWPQPGSTWHLPGRADALQCTATYDDQLVLRIDVTLTPEEVSTLITALFVWEGARIDWKRLEL